MEGMQTCLHGSGEKCLPKGPGNTAGFIIYTLIPVKHCLGLQAAHVQGSHCTLLKNTTREPLGIVHKVPKQYSKGRRHLWKNICIAILALILVLNLFSKNPFPYLFLNLPRPDFPYQKVYCWETWVVTEEGVWGVTEKKHANKDALIIFLFSFLFFLSFNRLSLQTEIEFIR